MDNADTPEIKSPVNQAQYDIAIAKGKEILSEGGSKADAARAIYARLLDETREVVLRAFMEGATVTEKGSPTYFYNISRKFKREQAKEKAQAKTKKRDVVPPDA